MIATMIPKNMKLSMITKMELLIAVKSIFVCHANSVSPVVMSTVPPTATMTASVLKVDAMVPTR